MDCMEWGDTKLKMTLTLLLKGGALFGGNRPKTTEEVLKSFLKQTKANYNRRVEKVDEDAPTNAPAPFQTFVVDVRAQINVFKNRCTSGNNCVKELLDGVEDTKLRTMKSVMGTQDGTTSEENIASISELLSDKVAIIKDGVPILNNLRIELTEMLIEQFAQHYSRNKGGKLQYHMEKYITDINEVLNIRQGRRSSESSQQEEPVSNCRQS